MKRKAASRTPSILLAARIQDPQDIASINEEASASKPLRRRGKEYRERFLALLALVASLPLIVVCAAAIKIEAIFDSDAIGPVFFKEARVSRGRVIQLIKFRTLKSSALESLGTGPTHIARFEQRGSVTRIGRILRLWYLDELPQLWNIVKGEMFLIGTRPYPLELYEDEMAHGITRKRDMPAGLIGPVQSHKGDCASPNPIELDEEYWNAFKSLSWWRLLLLDMRIVGRTAKVQLQHKGL